MIDYLFKFLHNIYSVLLQHEAMKNYADVIFKIITGVIAIIGIRYIKALREKTLGATFTFWSQLKIRLIGIQKWIKNDKSILNNLCAPEIRESGESLSQRSERVDAFKGIVKETIVYMEEASDQMPAYEGWCDDYNQLICYFKDILVYDISNSKEHFKFIGDNGQTEFENYCKSLINVIEKLCSGIEIRQKELEKKIVKSLPKTSQKAKNK